MSPEESIKALVGITREDVRSLPTESLYALNGWVMEFQYLCVLEAMCRQFGVPKNVLWGPDAKGSTVEQDSLIGKTAHEGS